MQQNHVLRLVIYQNTRPEKHGNQHVLVFCNSGVEIVLLYSTSFIVEI